MRKVVAIILSVLLSACVGVPITEVRNNPVAYETLTKRSMDDVMSCLMIDFDEFRGDGRMLITNYQQPSKVEISIGAFQVGGL